MVVHDQVAVAEQAGGSEGECGVAQAAVEGDGGVAQRAVGDEHRDAADDVVDDLVPEDDLQGVGAHVAVDVEVHDGRSVAVDAVRVADADVGGVGERHDLIAQETRVELLELDDADAEVGQPVEAEEVRAVVVAEDGVAVGRAVGVRGEERFPLRDGDVQIRRESADDAMPLRVEDAAVVAEVGEQRLAGFPGGRRGVRGPAGRARGGWRALARAAAGRDQARDQEQSGAAAPLPSPADPRPPHVSLTPHAAGRIGEARGGVLRRSPGRADPASRSNPATSPLPMYSATDVRLAVFRANVAERDDIRARESRHSLRLAPAGAPLTPSGGFFVHHSALHEVLGAPAGAPPLGGSRSCVDERARSQVLTGWCFPLRRTRGHWLS